MFEDLFTSFYGESRELLTEMHGLAGQLRGVAIPDDRQAHILAQLLQRLHRLIGGLAAIGFGMFAPVSRKTSLLAERSSMLHGATITELMKNITAVLTELSVFFTSKERLRDIEVKVPDIERRVDACMPLVSVQKPAITSQDEIDDIMKMFGKV